MYRRPRLLCAFFLIINALAGADEPGLEEILPALKNRAVVLDINARVVEQNQVVIWNESHQRVTIPGRPVGIKLVGANVVVAVQFTPYLNRRGQNFLVAQGQIWIDVPSQGISYQTTIQTIPLELGEPIYFFPLGSAEGDGMARIEIQLTMKPYRDAAAPDSGEAPGQSAGTPALLPGNNGAGGNAAPPGER